MTTTILQDIAGALHSALNGLALGYDIAWPGAEYDPQPGTAFLAPTVMPASTDAISLGAAGTDRYQGIYQVSVYTPLKDGEGKAAEIASQVAAGFRKALFTLGAASVRCGVPHAAAAQIGPSWIHLPVSIPYYLTT